MIDSIILRVKNMHSYPDLAFRLRQYDRGIKQVSAVRRKEIPVHQKFVHFMDDDKTLDVYSHRFDVSYSYSVVYRLDNNRNHLELNFSIPKYLYGTNVKMFVKHKSNRDFNYGLGSSIDHNLEQNFQMLIDFIIRFNTRHLQVDLSDITLKRLDFCFNQIFSDRVEKSQYLYCLKQKSKKFSRQGAAAAIYKTGIYYVSKYCTYKIYDKGPEFDKHDLNKLRQHISSAELTRLQKMAWRMLRYEVEFKSAFFKRYIRDELEKAGKSRYCNYLRKRFGDGTFFEEYATDYNDFELNFHVGSPNFFNRRLFKKAAMNFKKFLREYRVDSVPVDVLTEKMKRYNSAARQLKSKEMRRINEPGLKRFVEHFQQFGKDGLINNGLYKKSSYYRYLQKLQKLGFSNVEIISPMSFLNNWDLERYHDAFFFG